jgi:hypothetical protein
VEKWAQVVCKNKYFINHIRIASKTKRVTQSSKTRR